MTFLVKTRFNFQIGDVALQCTATKESLPYASILPGQSLIIS